MKSWEKCFMCVDGCEACRQLNAATGECEATIATCHSYTSITCYTAEACNGNVLIQAAKGAKGEQGEQGPEGLQGPVGLDGTPVRRVPRAKKANKALKALKAPRAWPMT